MAPDAPHGPAAPPAVLLVEDDPLVRELYGSMLRRMNQRVVATADADAALAQFAREDIGWVMLDIGLPDMPGLELLARLRAGRPDLPAVVVSGRADEFPVAPDDASVVFLAKPFQADDLRRAVARACGGGRAGAADA